MGADEDEMTYEEKMDALGAIALHPALHMRKPGDWYLLLPSVEIGGNSMLSSIRGDGATPEDAINAAWDHIVRLPANLYLVINAMGDNRRHVRWSGYMWRDTPLSEKVAAVSR